MSEISTADPGRDAAGCAAIYAHYVEHTVTTFELTAPTEAELAGRIERSVKDFGWLVARSQDGSVQGYAYGTHYNERPAYRWASLVSIYLDPAAVGHGLGSRLYDALFTHLRGRGIVTACAYIALPNPASLCLHERFGFAQRGVFSGIGFKHGHWIDVALLQRDLAMRRADPV